LRRIDHRIFRHHRLKGGEKPDRLRPLALVTLIRLFVPLSVFLFFFGLMIFLVHIGVSPGLVTISSLVIAGLLYAFFFLILRCKISPDESS
jgi:hypothetical protein